MRESLELNRLKTLNEADKMSKVLKSDNGDDHRQLGTTFSEDRKPLNCNFGVQFCITRFLLKKSF